MSVETLSRDGSAAQRSVAEDEEQESEAKGLSRENLRWAACRHSASIVYEFIKVLFILYSLAPQERERERESDLFHKAQHVDESLCGDAERAAALSTHD